MKELKYSLEIIVHDITYKFSIVVPVEKVIIEINEETK